MHACTQVAAWWSAYTAAYDGVARWSKKSTHAPFCYELLVAMLSLSVHTYARVYTRAYADTRICTHALLVAVLSL